MGQCWCADRVQIRIPLHLWREFDKNAQCIFMNYSHSIMEDCSVYYILRVNTKLIESLDTFLKSRGLTLTDEDPEQIDHKIFWVQTIST